jgi:transcriptional regulator with XRE-family HTH domain
MTTVMDIETNEDRLENIKFGILVFILRLFLHLNQAEFGRLCGLTPGTICLIEHGISSVISKNQKRIMVKIGVSRPEFFRYMDFNHQMKKLLDKFQIEFFVKQEKIDILYSYWTESPPMDILNPIKLLFPRCQL